MNITLQDNKLKLSHEDLSVLNGLLMTVPDLSFPTNFEENICKHQSLVLMQSFTTKLVKMKDEYSIKLNQTQMMVLASVIPRLHAKVEGEYNQNVIQSIYMEIHPQCLSLL